MKKMTIETKQKIKEVLPDWIYRTIVLGMLAYMIDAVRDFPVHEQRLNDQEKKNEKQDERMEKYMISNDEKHREYDMRISEISTREWTHYMDVYSRLGTVETLLKSN